MNSHTAEKFVSKSSARQSAVLYRRYLAQGDACREAILSLVKKRGRLPDKSGPNDAERRSSEIGAKDIIQE